MPTIKEIARIIWNIRREDEDRCDMEIEDLRPTHSVFREAEALIAELAKGNEPTPEFRGYAALGTGQYLLNACPATGEFPPELVISVATEDEKAGRVIGDLKDVTPGTEIHPKDMAVRLAFFSVAGLDALEQQLRILREESFPDTVPPTASQIEQETAEAIAAYLTSGRYMALNPGVLISAEIHTQYIKNHDIYQANAIRRGAWKEFKKS